MKKIYFACAVAGGRDYAFVYKDFVDFIKSNGVEVFGELFADPNLEAEVGTDPDLSPQAVWKRDTDWVRSADAFIAEVSQPSLGVGYEIALAESLKKPILVLFYKKSTRRFSPMVQGNPGLKIVEYSEKTEAKKAIKKFIKNLS
jgi:hypothetical protein